MSEGPLERIPSYVALLATYGSAVAVSVVLGRIKGVRLQRGYDVQDLVLGALATNKFTRLTALDGVTTPLRAPFTEFEEEAGSAEGRTSPGCISRRGWRVRGPRPTPSSEPPTGCSTSTGASRVE